MQRMLTSDTVSFCRAQILSEISWLLLTDRHDDYHSVEENCPSCWCTQISSPMLGASLEWEIRHT